MNEDTRVAVCCYAKDQHQVAEMLDLYLHHQCPVTILSPENSRADIQHPRVENRFGGKRCAIGQDALDRHREHLRILLTYPEEYFLIHDSDSVCLSPKLPHYLYKDPDVLWSNLIEAHVPTEQKFYPEGFPKVAFQPPWFMSRKTIEHMLARVAYENLPANPGLAFIDYWLVDLAHELGRPWKKMPDSINLPLHDEACMQQAVEAVRDNGAIFIHSVKGAKYAAPLIAAHAEFRAK